MMVPAERQLAQGNESAERRANLGANLLSLLFLIMLYLMIWKPGA
jgi:type II secretory pathway component PulM